MKVQTHQRDNINEKWLKFNEICEMVLEVVNMK